MAVRTRLIHFVLLFLGWAALPASATDILGQVTNVVDGDTFDMLVDGERVRIRTCGIDSPERGEPNYRKAKKFLREMIQSKEVECTGVGEGSVCDGLSKPKSNGRIVAQCFIDGEDIALLMVQAGMACDWPYFSGGHYARLVPGACQQTTRDPAPRKRPR